MLIFRMSLLALLFLSSRVFAEDPIPPKSEASQLCVILIGGIDSDPTAAQIEGTSPRGVGQSGMYQLAGDLNRRGIITEYFNWNGTRAGKIKSKGPLAAGIVDFIRDRHMKSPQEQFAIVANSWGGHTALEVCQALQDKKIDIELVVFLDPSSLGRAPANRPKKLPASIKAARNYYTRNVFGWREWPNETRLINIDLGDETQGFQVPGGPKYNATLDPQAHIAAEWDPRIHEEITKHVVALLNTRDEAAPNTEKPAAQ